MSDSTSNSPERKPRSWFHFNFRRPRLDARRTIYQTMLWSKASYLFIAAFAAIASSIRTVLAISENYAASGAPPWAVTVGAACFTLVAEVAIFILAIAQEDQIIKWRLSRKRRHITTLGTIWHSIQVRVGYKEPLTYDQLPESDGGVGSLIVLAFCFTIITNLYIGLRPLITQVGAVGVQTIQPDGISIQSFMGRLLSADAKVQFSFLIDLAAALFPPVVELVAGRLNARYAASVSASQRAPAPARMEHSKALPLDLPKPSNGNSRRNPNAYADCLAAYTKGMSKQAVIEAGIAKKSTAYAAWTEFKKGQNGKGGTDE